MISLFSLLVRSLKLLVALLLLHVLYLLRLLQIVFRKTLLSKLVNFLIDDVRFQETDT